MKKYISIIIVIINWSVLLALPNKISKVQYCKKNILNSKSKIDALDAINNLRNNLKDTLFVELDTKDTSKYNKQVQNHREALWLNTLCYLKQAEFSEFRARLCYLDLAAKPIMKLLYLPAPYPKKFPTVTKTENIRKQLKLTIKNECLTYFKSIENKQSAIDPTIRLCNVVIHDMLEEEKYTDEYFQKQLTKKIIKASNEDDFAVTEYLNIAKMYGDTHLLERPIEEIREKVLSEGKAYCELIQWYKDNDIVISKNPFMLIKEAVELYPNFFDRAIELGLPF